MSYDVFLSYSHADAEIVERVATRLTDEFGVQVFLDRWQLVPGDLLNEGIEHALASSKCCAVFIGCGGVTPYQNEEIQIAIERRITSPDGSFRVIPVLLAGAETVDRGSLSHFLARSVWVEFRDGRNEDWSLTRLVAGIRGERSVPGRPSLPLDDTCPFRGLQPFRACDARFFFGREAETQWLAHKLRESRFLAIIGPSGSGKSSLALAGLVPELQCGFELDGSNAWPIEVFRPGSDPVENLALSVGRLFGNKDTSKTSELIQQMLQSERALHRAAKLSVNEKMPKAVLVVDQFEELFKPGVESQERSAFIANLLLASSIAGGVLLVVITMRADFYGQCADYPDLAAMISGHQMLVNPMDRNALREAIAAPVRFVGLSYELGLVDLLLRDVEDEPGALPFLQFALLELWKRRDGRQLTLDAYQQLDGVRGALIQCAEAAFDTLDDEQQKDARRMMLRLTDASSRRGDTRRRIVRHRLRPAQRQRQDFAPVVDVFVNAHLLTSDRNEREEETIEVSHEALIRGWPRLRRWIEEDRASLLIHRAVADAAEKWDQAERDESFLFRGSRLAQVEAWEQDHFSEMNRREEEFVHASFSLRDAASRSLRTKVKGAVTGIAIVAATMAILAVLARGYAGDAERARHDAERARHNAETNLATIFIHRARASADVDEKVHLFWRAYDVMPEVDARRESMLSVIGGLSDLLELRLLHGGSVTSVAFSPDGDRVLTGSWDGTARVWDAVTGEPVTGPLEHGGNVVSVAFSPDGDRVLTGSWDGTARVWDAVTGEPVTGPLEHGGNVVSVAFSPDGARVLTGSSDETARVWDAVTGEPVTGPLEHGGNVVSVAFSPDGDRVLTGSWDGTARVWDAVTGEPVTGPLEHGGNVVSVAFSPDGARVLTGSSDKTARVWDAVTGEPVTGPLEHGGNVVSVAFSPDGARVLTGSSDETALVWDAVTGEPVTGPLEHGGNVVSVAFSPDGARVLTGSSDETARVWDAVTGEPVAGPLEHGGNVVSVAFSPDGARVLTGSSDETARVWDAVTGEPVTGLFEHGGNVVSVAFSPDGARVLTGSSDETARVWDAVTGEPVTGPLEHGGNVVSVAFSPDGARVLTGSSDETALVWDAVTGEPVTGPLEHGGNVVSVAFSPDGARVLTGSSDETARVWDAVTGEPVTGPLEHGGNVVSVAFSPDGARVLTGSSDETARVWDAVTGEPMTGPLEHGDGVDSVAFRPDGARVLTGSRDGTALVWDAVSGKPVSHPLEHEAGVVSVAFNPDGARVLTGSRDGTARVWDAVTGVPLTGPLEHGTSVTSVAFSPDGRLIFLASNDGFQILDAPSYALDDASLPRRLQLSVESRTGWSVNPFFKSERIDRGRLNELRQELSLAGGPSDRGLQTAQRGR